MNHMRGTYRVILLSLMLVLVVVSIHTIFTNYIVNATSSNSGLKTIEQLKRSIDSLHDKTITITTVHKNYNATNASQNQTQNSTK
jgi:hypothetical protein